MSQSVFILWLSLGGAAGAGLSGRIVWGVLMKRIRELEKAGDARTAAYEKAVESMRGDHAREIASLHKEYGRRVDALHEDCKHEMKQRLLSAEIHSTALTGSEYTNQRLSEWAMGLAERCRRQFDPVRRGRS